MNKFFVVGLIFLSGCATTSQVNMMQQKRERVYSCVVDLIKLEVSSREAGAVCKDIFYKDKINEKK